MFEPCAQCSSRTASQAAWPKGRTKGELGRRRILVHQFGGVKKPGVNSRLVEGQPCRRQRHSPFPSCAAREQAALDVRDHGCGANPSGGNDWLAIFHNNAVCRNQGPRGTFQRQEPTCPGMADPATRCRLERRAGFARGWYRERPASLGCGPANATTRPLSASTNATSTGAGGCSAARTDPSSTGRPEWQPNKRNRNST